VAIVVDTSVVFAALDRDEERHADVRAWLEAADEDLVTTPLALAEVDYLVHHHLGADAARAMWSDFESGAYLVRWWTDAVEDTIAAARRWDGLGIGLADASLVALAAQLATDRIATLDERHFRRVTTAEGEAFVVLPSDS
jgi:uncharacterized protein